MLWTGFVKDPITGDSLALYSDKRNISSTNFTWGFGEPNGGNNEACSVITGNCSSLMNLKFYLVFTKFS